VSVLAAESAEIPENAEISFSGTSSPPRAASWDEEREEGVMLRVLAGYEPFFFFFIFYFFFFVCAKPIEK